MFFTYIVSKISNFFGKESQIPNAITTRIANNFEFKEITFDFVCLELAHLKTKLLVLIVYQRDF